MQKNADLATLTADKEICVDAAIVLSEPNTIFTYKEQH